MRLRLPLLAIAASCAIPAAALAHDHGAPPPEATQNAATDAEGRSFGEAMPPQPADVRERWEADRAAWLDECRARMDAQDDWRDDWYGGHRRKRSSGLVGAAVGGVAGGLLGRGIAGRDDKTLGTVAGAVVGAAAGAAIERSASSSRDRNEGRRSYTSGDYCEQYFNYYTQQGWGHQGYGYGMAMMMVPVMQMQGYQHNKDCKETVVTEEWVTVRQPPRYRYIRVPDKRVRIVPDKRLPMK